MTSPVTMDIEGVPLRRTLYLLLDQLGLSYQVDDGIVFIAANRKRLPAGLTPFMLMQDRAERGEMDDAERKEYIEMLKDLKEIKSLLYQLDNVEKYEIACALKGAPAADPKPASPGGAAGGVAK